MATDDIRTLSETLAADPASLAFVPLGEALRRRGDLDLAWRVAQKGVERHPGRADAHDLVARIAVDRGDLERSVIEWEAVLRIEPHHPGARKGLGFICFQLGRLDDAAAHLGAALAANPQDGSLAAALETVQGELAARGGTERATTQVSRHAVAADIDAAAATRAALAEAGLRSARPTMGLAAQDAAPDVDAGALFDDLLEGQRSAAMLLDADGLVLAGRYVSADGRDLAATIGAQLSGVSDEASRAMRHLGLGAWRQIVFETDAASVAMAPSQDGVLLVAAARPIPLGFVRRVLERALLRALEWVGGTR
ncbi:MAG: tetratricopeptide repeat protein [Gemmatimonadaceae bacterium]|nr:tetratricopeptide repeat protein [Gemmatimonadaceae bacterium]